MDENFREKLSEELKTLQKQYKKSMRGPKEQKIENGIFLNFVKIATSL